MLNLVEVTVERMEHAGPDLRIRERHLKMADISEHGVCVFGTSGIVTLFRVTLLWCRIHRLFNVNLDTPAAKDEDQDEEQLKQADRFHAIK